MKKMLLGLGLALLLLGNAQAASIGVDFTSTPINYGGSAWNLGYEFQANNSATVTGLGNVDLTGAGYSQSQQVGLWTLSGTLLASTYVSSSDPLVNTYWRFNSITPVTLTAGQYYVVGGQGGAEYSGNDSMTVNPNITYVEDLYTLHSA